MPKNTRLHSPSDGDSLLIPIAFYGLDNIPLRVVKENDPITRDVLTDISYRIGFNAVGPQ